MKPYFGKRLEVYNFSVTSFVADSGYRCLVRRIIAAMVLKIRRISCRMEGDISPEGRVKGVRYGDEIRRLFSCKNCADVVI